jgi:hypothetical protein
MLRQLRKHTKSKFFKVIKIPRFIYSSGSKMNILRGMKGLDKNKNKNVRN